MPKEAFYFSHDSNARNDEKIVSLRMKYGWEGYGLFWAIVERLRECSDYMSVCDFNLIAYDLRSDSAKIKSIINDFGLFAFTEDGKCFYSESLYNRMKIKDEISIKAQNAANIRWGLERKKSGSNADAMRTHSDGNAIKERKEIKEKKERKKEISLTPDFPQMPSELDIGLELPEIKIGACIQLLKISGKGDVLSKQVLSIWQVFKIQNFTGKKFYNSKSDVYSHFINWIKTQQFEIPIVKKSLYDHEKILERQRSKLADS